MTATPFEIRLHGRGGQGVVTAAELLSVAAFLDGHEAQAFPSFGSERMGAPVMSFCRIADQPIRSREPVTTPARWSSSTPPCSTTSTCFGGLRDDGYALINSIRSPADLGLAELHRTARAGPGAVRRRPPTTPARHTGRPLPNVCLLGAFAALTERVSRASLETAVRERFRTAVADANIVALRRRVRPRPGGLPCVSSSKARGPSPRRWPTAGPRSCRPTRSRRRRTSSRPWAPWPRTARSPAASSSRSSRSSRRCRPRSAPPRPGPAPTRPRPARACCTWPRRCSTRRASACRSS